MILTSIVVRGHSEETDKVLIFDSDTSFKEGKTFTADTKAILFCFSKKIMD